MTGSPTTPVDAQGELLSCPFCGSKPHPHVQNNYRPKNGGGYWCAVWCRSCNLCGPEALTEPEAITAWNTRAAMAAPPRPVSAELVAGLLHAREIIGDLKARADAAEADSAILNELHRLRAEIAAQGEG